MAAINSVADLAIDGEVAVVTINSPPVNALSQAVRDGLKRGVEAAEANGAVKAIVVICGGRTFIAGADISEFGKPPAPPYLPDVLDTNRERIEAGRRRDPRNGARWRVRGRADGALPHRRSVGEMRPAGNQARPHPRRRRHAAPAAADRRREGARRHPVRHALRRARGQGMGRRRRARRGREIARIRACLRPPADRREGAAAQSARPLRQARARARPSRNFRGHPQGQREKIPRLRGLGEGDPIGQERRRATVRRGNPERARDVHGAPCRPRSPRRSGMCSSPSGRRRRSPTSAADEPTQPDPQRRRDRRRHDGRRHRHEFPQRRHSGDDRRDLEGGARPRRFDHAPQLREDRQEGPPDDGARSRRGWAGSRPRSTLARWLRPTS